MRRDASLVPLSHQHHNALAFCVLWARAWKADPTESTVRRWAQKAVDRYEIELRNHFEIEEQVLFPRVAELPLVARLIAEHRKLERLVDLLRVSPDAATLDAFTALLRQHVRKEENELFQEAQQRLPRSILDEIGRQIDSLVVRVCL